MIKVEYSYTELFIHNNQLAGAVGLAAESVSNIERGTHAPKFDYLAKFTFILNVQVVSLFEF